MFGGGAGMVWVVKHLITVFSKIQYVSGNILQGILSVVSV